MPNELVIFNNSDEQIFIQQKKIDNPAGMVINPLTALTVHNFFSNQIELTSVKKEITIKDFTVEQLLDELKVRFNGMQEELDNAWC